MATTTVADAVVLPQGRGTGIGSEDDVVDAAAAALLAQHVGSDYVLDGAGFANIDTANETVDVTTGAVYITDTSTSTSGARSAGGQAQIQSTSASGYDTELPTDQPYLVLLPTDETGLALGADATNDVYLSVDPTAQNSVTIHHGSGIAEPSDPHLHLGTVDSADGTTTRPNDGPALDARSVAADVGTFDYSPGSGLSLWANPRTHAQQQVPYPTFEKYSGNPIWTAADVGWATDTNETLNWPTIIHADAVFDDPLGTYYLYYSFHDNETGVGLAYSDDLTTWTDQGNILNANNDRENDVLYDPDAEELWLYAINDANDTVRLYTSPNGVDSWSAGTTVFEFSHCAYPKVFRANGGYYYVGYLKEGGESLRTLRYSRDGQTNWHWVRLFAGERDAPTGESTRHGAHNCYTYIPYQQGYLVAFREKTEDATADDTLHLGYTEDGTHISIIGECLAPTETWEDQHLADPYLFWADDRLWMVYAAGDGGGTTTSYGLAYADFSEVRP